MSLFSIIYGMNHSKNSSCYDDNDNIFMWNTVCNLRILNRVTIIKGAFERGKCKNIIGYKNDHLKNNTNVNVLGSWYMFSVKK